MMSQILNSHQEQVINKLTTLLDIKYIYQSDTGLAGGNQPLLIVVLSGYCSALTQKLSAMVAKICQEETAMLYRIFPLDYAEEQLIADNLFFVYHCSWDKLVYQSPQTEPDRFQEYQIPQSTSNNIQTSFNKESQKLAGFLKGATFFMDNHQGSHAAYMLHQYIELWFRFAALITMGKARKSHRIKELQSYIKDFAPELGNLFPTEIEAEHSLLNLLDAAYIATRYENHYHINTEQLQRILEKAKALEAMVTRIYTTLWEACTNPLTNPKERQKPNESCRPPNATEKANFIQSLSERDFPSLKPHRVRTGLYTMELLTEGYLDTAYMIANLVKVCLLAMESDYRGTRYIPDPEFNIKEVLGFILDMIPYTEMEMLDTIRDEALKTAIDD
ncbi:HEPN domain-containing protein [Bizionia hallyeonensis]|uniref:HEPN domain-containing protein n=1 Tax=Bizionia hallyeonensis TaxID=1123757 RepID=A0ABW0C6B3_9FLAO